MSVEEGGEASARKSLERLMAEARLLIGELEEAVRRKPLLAVGIAAAVGVVFGALRRR